MNDIDSKLFYGSELGSLPDILIACRKFIPYPHRKPTDLVDEVEWINTQLPDGLFLEITYPVRDCSEHQMVAHATMLDYSEEIQQKEMEDVLLYSNCEAYADFLKNLGLTHRDPVFYTRHYVYTKMKFE